MLFCLTKGGFQKIKPVGAIELKRVVNNCFFFIIAQHQFFNKPVKRFLNGMNALFRSVKGVAIIYPSLGGHDEGEGKLFFYSFGTQTATVKIPEDGEYTITVEASCTAAEKEMAKFKLTVGDVEVAKEHSMKEEATKPYEFTAKLKKGDAKLVIEFLNDKYKENEYDLNLFVHGVKVEPKKGEKK